MGRKRAGALRRNLAPQDLGIVSIRNIVDIALFREQNGAMMKKATLVHGQSVRATI